MARAGGRADSFKRLIHSERDDPRKTATVDAVLETAASCGVSPAQVALAWAVAQGVVPILGPRTEEQLADNIGAAGLTLPADALARLEAASAVPLGFPHEMMAAEAQVTWLAGGMPDRVETPAVPVA